MSKNSTLTRRDFIKVVSVTGGGLVLGFYLPSKGESLTAEPSSGNIFEPNAWLKIDTNGITTITVARSEMGQGPRTALPMIVAEELEADWEKVRLEFALAHPKNYGDMTTGGSTSVRNSWDTLRKAGATAREMLISAAAQTWNVDSASCRAEKGGVIHMSSERRLNYGKLVEAAAKLPVPTEAPLKDPKDFRLLGKNIPRLDTPEKVYGSAIFGIDMKVPGMLIAMVEHSPVFGGKVKSFDDKKALAIKGVRKIVEIPNGVAVVADSTYAAMQGRDALSVTWDEGPNAALSSESIHKMFEEKSKQEAKTIRNDGDLNTALAAAAKKIEATYEVPFLAHAPMEPMNCVADVRSDGAEIWAPTQAPQWAQSSVAEAVKLSPDKIKVHTTLLGGAFGRRTMPDIPVEAAHISKAVGAPVKLVWTREDDMHHDFYRPASYHSLVAAIDKNNELAAWKHQVVAPSISGQLYGGESSDRPDAVDGAAQLPYRIPNILIDYVKANTAVPIGWWRSVYHSQHAFVNESFMDEIAVAAGVDPYELRRRLLPEGSRLRGVLELVAVKAHWGQSPAPGRSRGIACHSCFGSYFAHVAEVSVDATTGKVRVHKIVCALDCGPIVHPDIIHSQVEGAVVLGLSAALRGEITIAKGRVEQSNFDDYPLLTFDEMPDVEVHIVPSTDKQGGIGEPGLPPVAPAVCNAIFAATGKRIRRLPIRAEDLKGT